MKVKCTVKEEGNIDIVYGKVYDVISIEWDWYRIIDESGEDYIYSPEAFEIVDPLPAPPVLTEEDINKGMGNIYTVIKHDIDEGNLVFPEGMTIEDWRQGRCVAYDKKPAEYSPPYHLYPQYAESEFEVAEPTVF